MFCVLPERMCARRKYERIYVVVEGECRFFVAYWSLTATDTRGAPATVSDSPVRQSALLANCR